MYMVQTAWPQANLLGVDMSTYKLAISQAKLEKKPEQMQSKVRFGAANTLERGFYLGLLGLIASSQSIIVRQKDVVREDRAGGYPWA